MLAEAAAVVAGRDLQRARPRRRLEPDPHRLGAPARARARRSRSRTPTRRRPGPCVSSIWARSVGHSSWFVDAICARVARPDLAAAARDAARERQDRALHRTHRFRRRSRRAAAPSRRTRPHMIALRPASGRAQRLGARPGRPAPRAASASASRHELLQVEVVLAEVAAVVARGEPPRARAAPPPRARPASPRPPAPARARR